MVDYFAVMGLKRSASDREIKEAYRRLAKLYHPDSNPDPDAARMMQIINAAKDVLFDPIKREEHRVRLAITERPFHSIPTYRPPVAPNWAPRPEPETKRRFIRANRPRSRWDRVWRKWFYGIVALLLVSGVGLVAYEVTRPEPIVKDPIGEIIRRYRSQEKFAPDYAASLQDTAMVPDDSLPRLKRHGDILFGLGEYRSASKFYERYLMKDSSDEDVIKNLSYAYFKRGKYAQSLDVLSRQMHGDSSLLVAYYNIGELFLREEKPFDARNAFQAAVKVGEEMERSGHTGASTSIEYFVKAKSELAKLE